MRELTEAQISDLRALATVGAWWGCRPGSNFMPLCCVNTEHGKVDGEMTDELARLGLLTAVHKPGKHDVSIGGGDYGPYGHIPAIDLDWDWHITPAGISALNPPAREEE